jgi:hypothetical protein
VTGAPALRSAASLVLLLAAAAAAGTACGVPPDRLPYSDRLIRDAGTDTPVGTCRAAPHSVLDGWPCGCHDDCEAGAICYDEQGSGIPGGACIRICTVGAPGACSNGAACPDLGVAGVTTSRCFPQCATTADCPPHQYCDATKNCQPACFDDDDCDSGHCDTFTTTCTAGPPPAVGAGVYEPCVRDDDCRSGLCSSTSGRCLTTCALSVDRCPAGSTCVVESYDANTDVGWCHPVCPVGGPCADPGLACSATGRPQDKTACFVPGTSATCTGLLPLPNTDQLACGCGNDCSWGATCSPEATSGRPHGTCNRKCMGPDGTPCGAGYVCNPELNSCVRSCDVDADCVTPGRLCTAWHECTPFCTTGADCASGGPCDPYSGRCRAAPTVGAAMGASCAADSACKSGFCDMTQRFCFGRCRVSAGCPDAAVCVPADPTWANDYGFCFPRCTSNADCTPFPGARCVATVGAPAGTPMHCE